MSLKKATDLAKTNPVIGLPRMAAVLRLRNGLEFYGRNSRKTHPLQKRFGKTSESLCLHAEIDSLRKALSCVPSEDIQGSSMYIARVDARGLTRLAKPCSGCQRALIAFDVSFCDWTT